MLVLDSSTGSVRVHSSPSLLALFSAPQTSPQAPHKHGRSQKGWQLNSASFPLTTDLRSHIRTHSRSSLHVHFWGKYDFIFLHSRPRCAPMCEGTQSQGIKALAEVSRKPMEHYTYRRVRPWNSAGEGLKSENVHTTGCRLVRSEEWDKKRTQDGLSSKQNCFRSAPNAAAHQPTHLHMQSCVPQDKWPVFFSTNYKLQERG